MGEPHLIIRGHSSPHTFTMRPSDAEALEGADIVFMVGDTMETALAGPVDTLAGHARVVKLVNAPGLVLRTVREGGTFEEHDHGSHGHGGHDGHDDHGHGHGPDDHDDHADDHGEVDLHVWLDPINGWTMARAIGSALADVDPANAATYEANVDALLHRLDHLTGEIAKEVAPARGVPFIVFHDGYRYFEDRFGLTAAGTVVISPERTPGVRRISELQDKVQELGGVCVFDEPQFDKRLVRTVIEGSDIKTGTVDPLGAGIEDGPELYFTLLRNMATAFKDCLAPA
ncbi:MAG: zinc ABC transporter substrate-binding protein [Rhodospirillales bacterium]|nr:zinc ABC transporter substrate-binding protein [Rhodospirillales bacterium]